MPIDSKPFSCSFLAALAATLIALAALPAAADDLDDDLLADERDSIESDLTKEEADVTVPEPEHMKAFSEVRWPELTLKSLRETVLPPIMEKTAPPVVEDTVETFVEPVVGAPIDRVVVPVVDDTISTVGLDRSPLTLNRLGDLAVLRPATAALGVLGAATYVVVAGPTLIFDGSKHAALRDDLLYGPWRNLRDRPLGEATPTPEKPKASEAEETDEAKETS